jgi:hypothetical protein
MGESVHATLTLSLNPREELVSISLGRNIKSEMLRFAQDHTTQQETVTSTLIRQLQSFCDWAGNCFGNRVLSAFGRPHQQIIA